MPNLWLKIFGEAHQQWVEKGRPEGGLNLPESPPPEEAGDRPWAEILGAISHLWTKLSPGTEDPLLVFAKKFEGIQKKAKARKLKTDINFVSDKQYCEEHGLHAGVMHPISDRYEMVAAPGYFPKAYLKVVKAYERSDDQELEVVNRWFSESLDSTVLICEDRKTKKRFVRVREREFHVINFMYGTGHIAANIYKIENEERAMQKLKTHLHEKQYASYFLTGQFEEQSKKSGVYYFFRRCRPTIAARSDNDVGWKFLASLCFHPVGYYSNSWCGGLVPSDDIISHLLMMRADEHMYWRKANQHSLRAPQANI
jgi:hypothetical protein